MLHMVNVLMETHMFKKKIGKLYCAKIKWFYDNILTRIVKPCTFALHGQCFRENTSDFFREMEWLR